MALKETTWRPDTCGCVLTYTWDDAVPQDQRTNTPARVVTACVAHPALSVAVHHDTVVKENRKKNLVRAALVGSLGPQHKRQLKDQDGLDAGEDFAVGLEFGWTFDSQRALRVTVRGLPSNEKQALRRALKAIKEHEDVVLDD